MSARWPRLALVFGLALLAAGPVLAQEAAQALQQQLRSIAEQASDAVVAIQAPAAGGSENVWDAQARGSGFLTLPEGTIVTDARFVRGRRRVDVRLRGGVRAAARVVGVDPLNHIAVLELEDAPQVAERLGGRLPALPLGSSADLRPGQSVFSISNAFDSLAVDGAPSFSWGIVTSIGRVREGDYRGVAIETDAAVNPGSFGGPLLDRAGRVVGLCSMPFSTHRWLGMAIPVDQVRLGVEAIVARKPVTHATLGLTLRGTGGEAQTNGVEVLRVVDGSPAHAAGVRAGDRLLALDGAALFDADDLARELEPLAPGSLVSLRLRRGDAAREVRVSLGRGETPVVVREEPARRPQQPTTARPAQPQPAPTPPARATLGVRTTNREGGGVQVVEVVPNGAAARAGVIPGDVLLAIGPSPLANLLDLRRVLDTRRPGDRVPLKVARDGRELELVATLDAVGQAPAPARTPGFLGVYLKASTAAASAEVERLAPGSPAEAAGLAPGDVIVGIDGKPVTGAEAFGALLREKAAGDRLRIEVVRGGARRTLTATLAPAPGQSQGQSQAPAQPARPSTPAQPQPQPPARPAQGAWLGAALVVRGGRVVVDDVDARGPVAQAGLEKGDVVLEAAGRRLTSLDDFEAVFRPLAPGARLELLIERGGWTKRIEVRLAARP